MQLRNTQDRYSLNCPSPALGSDGLGHPRLGIRHVRRRVSARAGTRRNAFHPYFRWSRRHWVCGGASDLADRRPISQAGETPLGAWINHVQGNWRNALYALLIAVPVTGIVVQFARGNALPLFGLAEIPSPWSADRTFARSVKEIHEVLAHTLVILAGLHAGVALVHHWIFRDRTLVRMLPLRCGNQRKPNSFAVFASDPTPEDGSSPRSAYRKSAGGMKSWAASTRKFMS